MQPADVLERVCAAYAWQRALGNDVERTLLCWLVSDRAHPGVWDANHVSRVRARTPAEIDRVLQQADAAFAHCHHRLFVVDPLTPPAFVARLALEDFGELTPTLQLVLTGALRATPPNLELRAVTAETDWQSLAALVRQDHGEGARTHGRALPAEVTAGLVAGYRKKSPACQFFLARRDGIDCGYGAGVVCEDRMGMVEDLFTLPAFRRRGVATAIIARAVAHVRDHGADAVLIGSHATEPPKRLYAALGFLPVCVTREYIKRLAAPALLTDRAATV
jgi:GNAT superfamily N-acetyltransferase